MCRLSSILELLLGEITNSVLARRNLFEKAIPDELLKLFTVLFGDVIEADTKTLKVVVLRRGFDRVQNGRCDFDFLASLEGTER